MEYIPIIASVFSAVSSISKGNSQADTYNAQAQANEYNAQIARQNAQTAQEQANANEETQLRKNRMVLGAARAGIAESGIGTEGSGSDSFQQSATNAQMDALNIRYQGLLQSQGFTNQSNLDDWQATQNRRNAGSARTGGYLGAGAALLSQGGGYLGGGNYAPVTTSIPRMVG